MCYFNKKFKFLITALFVLMGSISYAGSNDYEPIPIEVCNAVDSNIVFGEVPISEFGPNDRVGRLNYQTPLSIKKASRIVKQGKNISLAIGLDKEFIDKGGAFFGRTFDITLFRSTLANENASAASFFVENQVSGDLGVGTGIDSLGHWGRIVPGNGFDDDLFYNRIRYDAIYSNPDENGNYSKANQLAVEDIPPFFTRGIMLNITNVRPTSELLYTDPAILKGATAGISCEDIVNALNAQELKLEKGDVVLLHTGWLNLVTQDIEPSRFVNRYSSPGLTQSGAQFLMDRGAIAVGIDSWTIGHIRSVFDGFVLFSSGDCPGGLFGPPQNEGDTLCSGLAHQLLMTFYGAYVFEDVNTQALVDEGVDEFLFTLGVPKTNGATEQIVNPVATY